MTTPKSKQARERENLIFDRFEFRDRLGDFGKTLIWFNGNDIVKKIDIGFTEYPLCNACLFWRAETIEMTDLRTSIFRGEEYTNRQCPECKGVGSGEQCSCGEVPHRVACPMGFRNYFN